MKFRCTELLTEYHWSPSLRGRGLKSTNTTGIPVTALVALFARAWIEMSKIIKSPFVALVALFARAWIEMNEGIKSYSRLFVALFARAWIEIEALNIAIVS